MNTLTNGKQAAEAQHWFPPLLGCFPSSYPTSIPDNAQLWNLALFRRLSHPAQATHAQMQASRLGRNAHPFHQALSPSGVGAYPIESYLHPPPTGHQMVRHLPAMGSTTPWNLAMGHIPAFSALRFNSASIKHENTSS